MTKTANSIETIEAGASIDNASHSVIWMHGLGADANDFVPLIPHIKLNDDIKLRFVFPNAPVRPITANNGMQMRGWYDIKSLNGIRTGEDEEGLLESMAAIHHLIEQEIAHGIAAEKIFIAGFSQGSAMTLLSGLRYPQKLAGLIALSGYLPLADQSDKFSQANHDTAILMCHGTMDPIVPLQLSEQSLQHLQSLGYQVEHHTYPMQHEVCAEEVADISQFFNKYAV
ncbi:alpha/beta hydrolase [Brackiella oedipodis]|uniref:alpha/beta hydrolase n=1 Tax=Brackiella oedipodis TaxID=124225 RepID=UPI00048AC610|nr:carboxylesterase [Brackiella oedipodis]